MIVNKRNAKSVISKIIDLKNLEFLNKYYIAKLCKEELKEDYRLSLEKEMTDKGLTIEKCEKALKELQAEIEVSEKSKFNSVVKSKVTLFNYGLDKIMSSEWKI